MKLSAQDSLMYYCSFNQQQPENQIFLYLLIITKLKCYGIFITC